MRFILAFPCKDNTSPNGLAIAGQVWRFSVDGARVLTNLEAWIPYCGCRWFADGILTDVTIPCGPTGPARPLLNPSYRIRRRWS
ncbi:hypothetical protein MPLB_1870009 [Mesorhizobium sp. ORS 3324]|nr:hypothetical protein MPLB_1870009 [Mesorhizobium sp. ORS 3324]